MSTFLLQDSRPQTPVKAPPRDNRSFANLCMELGEDAELLKYLPYNRASFQPQYELQGAASERLLYGDMMEEKDQLWVYFTMLGGCQDHNKDGGNRMLTFYTLKGARHGEAPIRLNNIQKVALASAPFKLVRNGFQILAIAKYFFVKRGVDQKLQVPISVGSFKDDLVRACHNYKTVYVQATAVKLISAAPVEARANTTDRAASREVSRATSVARISSQFRREPSVFRAPSTTRGSSRVPRESPPDLRGPSQTGSIKDLPRKRTRSVSIYAGDAQPLFHYSPTPTHTQPGQERGYFEEQDRNAMVDKYIALQAQEEDLDRKINGAEEERSDIAAQIVGLQARLEEAEDNKAGLMDKKDRIKAEKRSLQSSLDREEQLEFGFEAGRRIESKRRKQN